MVQFSASDQIEAHDRRIDQLFGHHAALANWPRATTGSIPFLPNRARHAFDSQLARANWMTSQVIAICWKGALAPRRDEQHLKKKYHLKIERK
jgi:hypothetical protein